MGYPYPVFPYVDKPYFDHPHTVVSVGEIEHRADDIFHIRDFAFDVMEAVSNDAKGYHNHAFLVALEKCCF